MAIMLESANVTIVKIVTNKHTHTRTQSEAVSVSNTAGTPESDLYGHVASACCKSQYTSYDSKQWNSMVNTCCSLLIRDYITTVIITAIVKENHRVYIQTTHGDFL